MTNAGRLRLTGYAALQVLLSVPALVLFILANISREQVVDD